MGSSVFEFCHLHVKGQKRLRPGPRPEEATKATFTALPSDLAPEQQGRSQGVGWDSLGVSGLQRMMLACRSQGKARMERAAEGWPQDWSGPVSSTIKWG